MRVSRRTLALRGPLRARYARAMGSLGQLWLATVVLSLLVASGGAARAASGDGVGLGPVIAFSPDSTDAVSLGWELSGSIGALYQRASVGGSYVYSSKKAGAPSFHYAAWEPWGFIGGTLGVGITGDPRVKLMYGAWEGLGLSMSGREPTDIIDDAGLHWVFSVSVGWRGIGFDHQFYFTPKIWRIRGWDAFT